jgi:type IV pilus assembly protein PilA
MSDELILGPSLNKEVKIMKNKNKKGFTLIELIAVIAILGILAAILVPNITGYIEKANVSKAVSDAKVVLNAVDAYNAEADASAVISEGSTANETTHIVGIGLPVKSWPSELSSTDKVEELRIVADKSLYNGIAASKGHWTITSGTVVVTMPS